MNSLIFYIALLLDFIATRAVHAIARVPFSRIFAALAVAMPLALVTYAAVRYGNPIARATVVVLGSERIVLGLLALLVARVGIELIGDAIADRSYRAGRDAPVTTI